MHLLRKGVLQFFTILFVLGLLGLGTSAMLVYNFGSSTHTKRWLGESKVYDSVAAAFVEKAAKADSGSNAAVYSNSAVLQLADRAFTQQVITKSVDTVVDANYAWLAGKTAAPAFQIDLTAERNSFAKQVGDYIALRLSQLPTCTASQLLQLQVPTDPLTVACRPPTIDAKTEGGRVTQEILASKFLEEPVITGKNIQSGEPYYESFAKLPSVFQAAQVAPYGFLGVVLFAAIAILFLAQTKRKGIRRLGFLLASTGVLLVVPYAVARTLSSAAHERLVQDTVATALHRPLFDFIDRVIRSMALVEASVGGVFIALGVALLIAQTVRTSGQKNATRQTTKEVRPVPPTKPSPVTNTPPQPRTPAGRSMDIMGPVPARPQGPKPVSSASAAPTLKKQPKPRRPRLIQ